MDYVAFFGIVTFILWQLLIMSPIPITNVVIVLLHYSSICCTVFHLYWFKKIHYTSYSKFKNPSVLWYWEYHYNDSSSMLEHVTLSICCFPVCIWSTYHEPIVVSMNPATPTSKDLFTLPVNDKTTADKAITLKKHVTDTLSTCKPLQPR